MSDVHSNPRALAAALADARRLGCARFVMLGDVTGYGYDAPGALKAVKESFDIVLMGNHDSACIGREPYLDTVLNRNYSIDVAQRSTLSEEDMAWLRERPFRAEEGCCAFVHGDFTRPQAWRYVFNDDDAKRCLDAESARILFCGHTHHAAVWQETGRGGLRRKLAKALLKFVEAPETRRLHIPANGRMVVNVGSVGYPRNDLCSSYAIYDDAAERIDLRRLPFDFKAYIDDMTSAGVDLPAWLVTLLLKARDIP